ncbi:MAG: bifunctional 4-hydroxy-2-oxoglutarate aldolase/2-dehydro-3-deoxy-phosphogluconate aldolase [Chloroflexota bacterium]
MKSRLGVYNAMLRTGVIPVFFLSDRVAAANFMGACLQGGLTVMEMTNRGENALEVFKHLRATYPDAILGIGSVVDGPTAGLYLAHGANFVVGPNFDVDVSKLCNSRKVAYLPGCTTPTEIHHAEQHGAEIVKLFPASVYGPGFIRSVLAPTPWTRIMPTGGIEATEESVKAWAEAGAFCVGIGSSLSKAEDVVETSQNLLSWWQQYRRWDDA